MTRQELADKWDLPIETIKRLVKKGELVEGLPAINGRNRECIITITEESIKKFEQLKRIPSDPVSYKTVKKMTGKTSADLYYYESKGTLKGIKINERLKLYSKRDVEKWLASH